MAVYEVVGGGEEGGAGGVKGGSMVPQEEYARSGNVELGNKNIS